MSKALPRVCVADDQPDVLESLRFLLRSEGFEVELASSPSELLESLGDGAFDVVLMDLNYTRDTTSGREGLELLERIERVDPHLPVVVMTAWSSVELAVEAMRRGARDFVEKPWDNQRLLSILRTQVELGRALKRGERLEQENRILRDGGDAATEMIAGSRAMEPVIETIERVGPSAANVLITGENGTGKGLVARCLHRASDRRDRPLVTVNLGGLSDSVFESELFGHVRGAFTDARSDRVGRFELADGGTLFLDEIANVPLHLQAKLLRVVETGELERLGSSRTQRVDVRLISATNADIVAEIREGRFRQDLFYRLNTVHLHVPPLRDRREDIPALAHHFLEATVRRYRRPPVRFEEDAKNALRRHGWPGNVRELSHVVERAVLMARRPDRISVLDLGLDTTGLEPDSRFEDLTLDEVEGLLVARAMSRYGGNVSDASRALGLSRSALYRRLEKHDIEHGSSSENDATPAAE